MRKSYFFRQLILKCEKVSYFGLQGISLSYLELDISV